MVSYHRSTAAVYLYVTRRARVRIICQYPFTAASSSLPPVVCSWFCLPRRLESREPSGLCRGKVTNENIGHAKNNPTLSDGLRTVVMLVLSDDEET